MSTQSYRRVPSLESERNLSPPEYSPSSTSQAQQTYYSGLPVSTPPAALDNNFVLTEREKHHGMRGHTGDDIEAFRDGENIKVRDEMPANSPSKAWVRFETGAAIVFLVWVCAMVTYVIVK